MTMPPSGASPYKLSLSICEEGGIGLCRRAYNSVKNCDKNSSPSSANSLLYKVHGDYRRQHAISWHGYNNDVYKLRNN